jgi:hypothetical protein
MVSTPASESKLPQTDESVIKFRINAYRWLSSRSAAISFVAFVLLWQFIVVVFDIPVIFASISLSNFRRDFYKRKFVSFSFSGYLF